MEESKNNIEEMDQVNATVEEEGQEAELDLMDQEIGNFKALMEKDPQEAYRRYGFSLLCSLKTEDMAREVLRIRKKPEDICDLYNKGVFEMRDGKLDKAIKDFEKAKSALLAMDPSHARSFVLERPTLPMDLATNIYLAMSEQGHKSEAKKECKEIIKFAKGLFPNEDDLPAMYEAAAQIEEEL